MNPTVENANWDNLMLCIPLVGLLIFGYFRVDEIFGPKKPTTHPSHPTIPVRDPAEPSLMTDPDGTPWQ
jgi:hypothetical protein